MKKTKRIVALVCTLNLVAGIMCGAKAPEKRENIIVDILQFKVEAKDALEKAAKEYMTINPNVKINIQTVGGGEDYNAALKSKFESGIGPTIYNIGGTQDVIDWEGKLEDLSKEPWVDKAFEGTLEAVTMNDGRIVGMPFNQEGYGFIYNKEMFTKAGIKPASIKTYTDLEKTFATLEAKKKDLGIDAPISLPGKETWVTGLQLSNVAFANEFANVKKAFEAKTIDFKYNEQLKKLLDLQIKYGIKPDGSDKSINSVDYLTQVEKHFSLGKVAMIQQGNWTYDSIKSVDEKLAKNIGILPMPLDGVKEGAIPVGVPMYWAVNSNKDKATKRAAKDFLNWLYTSDRGKEMIIKDFNFIPVFKGYDGENLKSENPLAQEVLRYANEGKTMPWVFMGYPTGWGMNKLGVDIQKYIAGDLGWNRLVENAKKSWEEARGK